MKQLVQYSLISGLFIGGSAFALNPVQGFYAGIMAGVSHGVSSRQITFTRDQMLFSGKESYSPIGGGGGGVLGYKYNQFRLEGELLYNRISTGPLRVNNCTLQSPDVETPTGFCPEDNFQADGVGFNGSSAVVYGLVNAYWDFFSYEGRTSVAPYLGLGVGQARIKDSINFTNTNTMNSRGESVNSTSQAGQVILGLSYYMDDFTWAGMDYRYLTTRAVSHLDDGRYTLNTINFNINFAFDKGGIN